MAEEFKVGDIIAQNIYNPYTKADYMIIGRITKLEECSGKTYCTYEHIITDEGVKEEGTSFAPVDKVYAADESIKEMITDYKNIIKELEALCQK